MEYVYRETQFVTGVHQVHGGSGYTEHFPASQYLRDARITMIYEGTNEIQAIDLLVRTRARGFVVAGPFLGVDRLDLVVETAGGLPGDLGVVGDEQDGRALGVQRPCDRPANAARRAGH